MTHVNLAVRFYISKSRNVLRSQDVIFIGREELWRDMKEWKYSSTDSLNLALDGGERSASLSGRCTPAERSSDTHWIRSWLDPKAGLDVSSKRKLFSLPSIRTTVPRLPSEQRSYYTDYAIPAPKSEQKYDTPPPEQLTTIPRRLSKITAVTLVECRFNTLGIIFY